MPKTASKTRVARHLPLSPAASLTAPELKELIALLDAAIESNRAPFYETGESRYFNKLERIKGKLRRGF